MLKLKAPVSANDIQSLKIGDIVAISGVIATGRDEAHRRLFNRYDEKVAAILKGSFIYHCGPIVKKVGGRYDIISCGPTTSIREEPYQAEIIRKYGIRGIIGKGGMGDKTSAALKECKSAYFQATGGAAALLSQSIQEVLDVYFLDEFGSPEAMWIIKVKDMPAVVTMDSHGNSLHKNILKESSEAYEKLKLKK